MNDFAPGGRAPAPLNPTKVRNNEKKSPDGDPLVSIVCLTYNHADFIEAAVNGFLAQETTFPYEIIVRDDASTDGTQEVLKRLARENPGQIQLMLNSSNLHGKKGDRSAPVIGKARGALIAFCEGDDYWIRRDKLQIQVDLIRSCPAASSVTTGQVNIEGDVIESVSKLVGGSRTLIFWKKYYPLDFLLNHSWEIPYGDSFLRSVLLFRGKMLHIGECTAVWRRHGGGVHASLGHSDSNRYFSRQAQTRFWTAYFFQVEGEKLRARYHLDQSIRATKKGLGMRHFSAWTGAKILLRTLRRVAPATKFRTKSEDEAL